MSVDYRPRRRKRPWPLIVALVAFGGFAVAMGEVWWLKARADRDKAQAIVGPPCPSPTAEAFAQLKLPAPKAADYEGMSLSRSAGHMSCELKGGAYICQFTSPIAVVVAMPGAPTAYFHPGVGRPATVFVRDGVASCVMASNFRV